MTKAATDRLKFNPPLGLMPALQYLLPSQLQIDAAYQRDIEAGSSQTLIRKIAQFWNWDLCQPLVVARREDGRLFVIDGQHRLAAARLRGDIAQLPAVVVQYASTADEAASFVHLNQQRRPLGKLDLFKAALASGDSEATSIMAALEGAGLSVAPHSNFTAWKPGMLANISGIEAAWRQQGPAVTGSALAVLAQSWAGQVLQFAGTLFPGIVAICSAAHRGNNLPNDARERLILMLGERKQAEWVGDALRAMARNPGTARRALVISTMMAAWNRKNGFEETTPASHAVELKFKAEKGWCDQCDMMVTREQALGCKSRHCSAKAVA